jgi:hypothetical protein
MNISLNIFTNSTKSAPSTATIMATYGSFLETFGDYPVSVYIDSHPNVDASVEYACRLMQIFRNVYSVDSLSHGYTRAIRESDADYLFMLEHDWTFNRRLVKHGLQEICDIMRSEGLYHFRFNKRSNSVAVWDKRMDERSARGLIWCESNNLSNNPHIIDRRKYVEDLIQYITIMPGSKGIEEQLNAVGGLISCVYGAAGYPATIAHLDGRRAA